MRCVLSGHSIHPFLFLFRFWAYTDVPADLPITPTRSITFAAEREGPTFPKSAALQRLMGTFFMAGCGRWLYLPSAQDVTTMPHAC